MKQAKKIVALLLCAALLVGATIAGTLAYLTSTDSVTNTFTVGNVAITMDETLVDEYGNPAKKDGTGNIVAVVNGETPERTEANIYKLIPGHTYTKDPTIKVSAGSEDCYIFVEINNGLGADATLNMSTSWAKVSENDNDNKSVWVFGTTDDPIAVGDEAAAVVPFDKFTFGVNAKPSDHVREENGTTKSDEIVVTAYAIQKDGLEDKTAAELWTLFSTNSGN